MGGTGIILVSSGLIAISLIPRTADIIYIAVGILAGNLNCTDIYHLKNYGTYCTNNFPTLYDKLPALTTVLATYTACSEVQQLSFYQSCSSKRLNY